MKKISVVILVLLFVSFSSLFAQKYKIKKIYLEPYGLTKGKGEIIISDTLFSSIYGGIKSEFLIELVSETNLAKQYKNVKTDNSNFECRISFFPNGINNKSAPYLTYEIKDNFSDKYLLTAFYLELIE